MKGQAESKTCTQCDWYKHFSMFALTGKGSYPDGTRKRRSACKICCNEKQNALRLQRRRKALSARCSLCGSIPEPAGTRGKPLYELRAKKASNELLAIALDLHILHAIGAITDPLFHGLAVRAKRLLGEICGRRWLKKQQNESEHAKLQQERGKATATLHRKRSW